MQKNDAAKVGLIGLGAMGLGMAGSLRRAGYEVHVCDIRVEATQAFAAAGGVACLPAAPGAATVISAPPAIPCSNRRRPG